MGRRQQKAPAEMTTPSRTEKIQKSSMLMSRPDCMISMRSDQALVALLLAFLDLL